MWNRSMVNASRSIRFVDFLWRVRRAGTQNERETMMAKSEVAKIDLDAISIDELAALRDNATAKLLEKVAARQVELEAEIERLSQYGKQVKKAVAAAPVVKTKKGQDKSADEASETSVAEAA
jgi:hypothetical protein